MKYNKLGIKENCCTTGQFAIHDLLNKKDAENKKTDEKVENGIARICLNKCADTVQSLGHSDPRKHVTTVSAFNQSHNDQKQMVEELPVKGIRMDDEPCVINASCVSHICEKVRGNPSLEVDEH
ncbi:hypothetical protein T10_3195 [Trichinella papuae]|uniref:Uncharacterized protein n=1 Tax=Trichinella papuae TaxID=268474 RepID=A0A0V1M1R3_9BILA|nr:hypothetical protein T10_10714 [Trichinella papuae]KRZ65740.1 hypothetical protein T10_3195 [Trichinella papuae]